MGNTKSAYQKLGKSNFYDGMITSTTFSGSLVNRVVWRMNKEEKDTNERFVLYSVQNVKRKHGKYETI